jgi:CHASE2 domain-containing sensor protein
VRDQFWFGTRALFSAPRWSARGAALAITLAALVAAGIGYASRHAWLFWLEHWTGDSRTSLLADRMDTQHAAIAVVTVTEETMEAFPYRLPIDRGMLAELVTRIDQAGARAIGIDMLFIRATEPTKDDALAVALRRARANVVLAVADTRAELSPAQEAYQRAFLARTGRDAGYVNLHTGNDGRVRYIPGPAPGLERDPTFGQSFAVALAGRPATPASPMQNLMRIAWLKTPRDGADTFLTVPAEVLAPPPGARPSALAPRLAAQLKDKVVLIGAELVNTDVHRTPLGEHRDGIAGVYIHAHAVAQLLDGRLVRHASEPVFWALLFALALLGMLLGRVFGFIAYSLYGTALTLGIVAIDAALFIVMRSILPFTSCFVALLLGLVAGVAMRRLGISR